MYRNFILGILAAQAREHGGQILAMTATSTPTDNVKIKKMCDMNPAVVTIRKSPVTDNHMYYRIQRPPSVNGFSPGEDPDIKSTLSLVCLLVLDSYVRDIMEGRPPKIIMIFAQSYIELNSINRFLLMKFKHLLKGKPKPWIINHSEIGNKSKNEILNKLSSGQISLIATTSVMLCGLDSPRVDIIVVLRPFGHLSSSIQAGGRGGRNQADGLKRLVAVFLLYNNTDIRDNAKFVTKPVKLFFRKNMCTRLMLHKFFCPELAQSFLLNPAWCCETCSNF